MCCAKIKLSKDGLAVSRIVAGMWRMADWNMDVQQRISFIEQCVEMGATTFDHADLNSCKISTFAR